ncbi:GTPase HflX [Salaquimonas pukyongi]|uniref:GTPase HflX n=1 Tax=Salaquimonas pukyongi TaxID=2712698 RepID=UPI00096BCE50
MSEPTEGGRARFQWSQDEAQKPERAIVLVPDLRAGPNHAAPSRSAASRLEEARGLAEAIRLVVAEAGVIALKTIKPATLMGTGKVEEIAGIIKAGEIGLAIVDHALSPIQQRNLEKAWNCKVLDRTGLILEIFGDRARTREGRLQVDLAHLNYQKGRLVRQWTHLERQRGGAGFMGGPGETQIEADRREIQAKIIKLENELEKVRRTRELHRAGRKRRPHPVVALVGYTNAGKSTLFNRLTGSKVLAKDMLFATLDPTLRQLTLPGGTEVIVSDTVGFISDLPTHLIAAFRATLEEVVEADVILHVRDIADPENAAQAEDVYAILSDLGIGEEGRQGVVEVLNKIDLLPAEALAGIRDTMQEQATIAVSAVTGEGIEALLERIEAAIGSDARLVTLHLEPDELSTLPQIYRDGSIVTRRDNEDGSIDLTVRLNANVREGRYRAFLAQAS